jgi:NADH:ubiquinone oxidoreductase subunit 6 (subunit J)
VLVISALGIIFLPRIVYSAVSMIVAFLAVAGIFVLLNADFVGISQVIIYAVGITIVMIFAIMLTSQFEDKKLLIAFKFRTLFGFGAAGLLFLSVIFAVTNGFTDLIENSKLFLLNDPTIETLNILSTQGTTALIGRALLTKYVLPFELLSILLLGTIVGTVVIAGKDNSSSHQTNN